MAEAQTGGGHPRTHTVRPRWTWTALLVLLAGLVVTAIGNLAHSWTLMGIGIAMLVIGGGLAVYGGFFYNVQGGGMSAQLEEAAKGGEHEFPDARSRRSEDEVKEDVHRRWLHDT
jgi:predicted membrane channel-forming protein YqfA (hemolysin III family)